MQEPGTECGLSIGFDAFLLSFSTNRVLLFRVSLCLCPPGQNSGISNISVVASIEMKRRPSNTCRTCHGKRVNGAQTAQIKAI